MLMLQRAERNPVMTRPPAKWFGVRILLMFFFFFWHDPKETKDLGCDACLKIQRLDARYPSRSHLVLGIGKLSLDDE